MVKMTADTSSEAAAPAGVAGEASALAHPTIFVLGITPRSGTNFLHRLLCQHPACGAINTTPVREDYLTHNAGFLAQFVGRLRWQWGHWGADDAFVEQVAMQIGEGLQAFMHTLTDEQVVVTKTPSVRHLNQFFRFFPQARLLIIVRDGRSVVESGMTGMGWDFEAAARKWATAARQIQAFQREQQGDAAGRFMVVKYEDLNANTPDVLKHILDFAGLDAMAYDFEAASQTPIYGSSYIKEEGDKLTWTPKPKTETFAGAARWEGWSAAQHARFNWIAGAELEAMGYSPMQEAEGIPRKALLNKVLDARYAISLWPTRFAGAVKAGIKSFLSALRSE